MGKTSSWSNEWLLSWNAGRRRALPEDGEGRTAAKGLAPEALPEPLPLPPPSPALSHPHLIPWLSLSRVLLTDTAVTVIGGAHDIPPPLQVLHPPRTNARNQRMVR